MLSRRQFIKFLSIVPLAALIPNLEESKKKLYPMYQVHDEIVFDLEQAEARICGYAGREYDKMLRHAMNYGMGKTRFIEVMKGV